MPWVLLDDASATHPKFIKAGVAAYGLWAAGLTYCNRYLTDGLVPKDALELLVPGTSRADLRKLAKALCTNQVRPGGSPSWIEEADGYRYHDYADFQKSREEVLADRRAARDRKKNSRSRVGHTVTGGVTATEQRPENGDVTAPSHMPGQPPYPTLPSPTQKESPKAGSLSGAPPPVKHAPPQKLAEEDDFEAIEARILAVCPPEMLAGGEAPNRNAIYRAVAHQRSLRSDGTQADPSRPSRTVTEFCEGIEAWKASGRWGSKAGAFSHAPHLTTYLDNKRHLVPLPAPKASAVLAAGTTPEHLRKALDFDRETA